VSFWAMPLQWRRNPAEDLETGTDVRKEVCGYRNANVLIEVCTFMGDNNISITRNEFLLEMDEILGLPACRVWRARGRERFR
jgi:hypothetical protein